MKTNSIIGIFFALLLVVTLTSAAIASDSMGNKGMEKSDRQIFENKGVNVPAEDYVPDEIIVKFKDGVGKDRIDKVNLKHRGSIRHEDSSGSKRIAIPQGATVSEMVDSYRSEDVIEYAEPNYIAHAFMVPNDPYYYLQWNMKAGNGINAEPAWGNSIGAGVTVAVVDTGVAYENYPASLPKYLLAPDLANTCFVKPWDFVNNDAHPNDDNAHGTHVAGTIGQSTNNNVGVAGVAFGACIMPIKVLDALGSGSYDDVANGIRYAADNGAQVITMSLGGSYPSITMENALAYAKGKDVTIFAAAGNGGAGSAPSYPAAYDNYVIAVAATGSDGTRASFSTTGNYVDIAAPGVGILQQTFNPNTRNPKDFSYWYFDGTSMATPHVSGVAALLISKGITSPDQVRKVLQDTAQRKGTSWPNPEYGYGIVDASAALNSVSAPLRDVAVTSISAPASAVNGTVIAVNVNVKNEGNQPETFTVTVTDDMDSVNIGSRAVSLNAGASQGLSFNFDTTPSSIRSHTLRAAASTVAGETDTADNVKTTVISINLPSVQPGMHIAGIVMSTQKISSRTRAIATVSVVDRSGNPLSGVSVSGKWSVLTGDSDSGTTDSAGKVKLYSDWVYRPRGTFTFTVNTMSKSGWVYDNAANVMTSNSITV